MPANAVYDFNTLTLVDADGVAFAVLCAQQDSIYKGKIYSILLTIEQKGSGA
ncbi:phage tail protein [Leclercia adecarboxylata]|nr:phage tail protein [Leclercia adecarboxylata]MBZ3807026.1 phage tail protein [Leclercia adecarboxylata]